MKLEDETGQRISSDQCVFTKSLITLKKKSLGIFVQSVAKAVSVTMLLTNNTKCSIHSHIIQW